MVISTKISQGNVPGVNYDPPDHTKQVPNGVKQQIFSYVGKKDLGRCSQVSKQWKTVADSNPMWEKYTTHTNWKDAKAACRIDSMHQKEIKAIKAAAIYVVQEQEAANAQKVVQTKIRVAKGTIVVATILAVLLIVAGVCSFGIIPLIIGGILAIIAFVAILYYHFRPSNG